MNNIYDKNKLQELIICGMTIAEACELFKQAILRYEKGENSDVVIFECSKYVGGIADVDKHMKEGENNKPMLKLDNIATVYKYKKKTTENDIVSELEKSEKPITKLTLETRLHQSFSSPSHRLFEIFFTWPTL